MMHMTGWRTHHPTLLSDGIKTWHWKAVNPRPGAEAGNEGRLGEGERGRRGEGARGEGSYSIAYGFSLSHSGATASAQGLQALPARPLAPSFSIATHTSPEDRYGDISVPEYQWETGLAGARRESSSCPSGGPSRRPA